jgi:hypothetical protein
LIRESIFFHYTVKRNKEFRMDKKQVGCSVAVVVFIALMFILLPGLGPMRWIIRLFYVNPVFSISLTVGVILLFVSVDFGYEEVRNGILLTIGILSIIFSIFWLIFSNAFMMYSLYNNTDYEKVDSPYSVVEFRNASYMEAKENFRDQIPDARYDFVDLDYVRGSWIADFSPRAGITPLTQKTAGFFEYEPGGQDPVIIKRQQMAYAEGGWLWNSADFFIYNKAPFAKFTEILYVADPESEGDYMAVTSLIYRKGITRVPYVGKIMIIYGNGDYEYLSTRQAERDPRLQDIQLTPEWLAQKRALAYGWRNGPFVGTFTKRDRVNVQRSDINSENSAPYHLNTSEGMMWYTPLAPRGKESLKGIAMELSGEIDGTVSIWMLPGDQAWRGVDALATTIKGAPRSQSINWLRVSGDVRSGDTDIIELLPCPRLEDDNVVLYMCGYVSTDPPKSTRFYTIIRVSDQEILRDLHSVRDINMWLNGELEVPPLVTENNQEITCGNPQDLTEEEILQCIQMYAEELQNRK